MQVTEEVLLDILCEQQRTGDSLQKIAIRRNIDKNNIYSRRQRLKINGKLKRLEAIAAASVGKSVQQAIAIVEDHRSRVCLQIERCSHTRCHMHAKCPAYREWVETYTNKG